MVKKSLQRIWTLLLQSLPAFRECRSLRTVSSISDCLQLNLHGSIGFRPRAVCAITTFCSRESSECFTSFFKGTATITEKASVRILASRSSGLQVKGLAVFFAFSNSYVMQSLHFSSASVMNDYLKLRILLERQSTTLSLKYDRKNSGGTNYYALGNSKMISHNGLSINVIQNFLSRFVQNYSIYESMSQLFA